MSHDSLGAFLCVCVQYSVANSLTMNVVRGDGSIHGPDACGFVHAALHGQCI